MSITLRLPSYKLVKTDSELREVTGWASVVSKGGKPYVDHQGDIIDMANLRAAVEKFMDAVRTGGYMHQTTEDGKVIPVGKIVGSLIVDRDMARALKMDTDLEGWLITMKVLDDNVWGQVKAGMLTGFSIGAMGRRMTHAG